MSKLTYVEMRFDDGRKQRLFGGEANAWFLNVNSVVAAAAVHGFKLNDHPWVIETKTSKGEDEK